MSNGDNMQELRKIMRIVDISNESVFKTLMQGRADNKTSIKDFTIEEHVDRAWKHLEKYLGNDKTEDHLKHALTRIAIALTKEYKII